MNRWIPALLLIAMGATADPLPRPALPFAPAGHPCLRARGDVAIDGRLDDPAWREAPWTDAFVDIEGDLKPAPRLRTRVKMLWNADHLLFGAELEEPDLWATLDERDAVIFLDNDFEVFIDPDGDVHDYFELEINALNTVWDLFLVRPYRDGGPALHAWDIPGLLHAVHLDGTLNDPSDSDRGWTVEIAIPWTVLAEAAGTACPPATGDRWRLNFSRVQWDLEAVDDGYVKLDRPEHNWVWSAQGLVNMHYPERWGIVEFRDDDAASPVQPDRADRAGRALMELYYAQRDHRAEHGRFTPQILALDLGLDDVETTGFDWPPRLDADDAVFHASTRVAGRGRLHVDQTGRLWWSGD